MSDGFMDTIRTRIVRETLSALGMTALVHADGSAIDVLLERRVRPDQIDVVLRRLTLVQPDVRGRTRAPFSWTCEIKDGPAGVTMRLLHRNRRRLSDGRMPKDLPTSNLSFATRDRIRIAA